MGERPSQREHGRKFRRLGRGGTQAGFLTKRRFSGCDVGRPGAGTRTAPGLGATVLGRAEGDGG